MEKNKQENRPVKLTIIFADGRAEDYSIFMGVVAKGTVPVDKIDDRIFHMAPEEGFSTEAFSAIAATPEVIAALLNTMIMLLVTCIQDVIKDDPIGAIKILEAMDELSIKVTKLYHETGVIKKNISGN